MFSASHRGTQFGNIVENLRNIAETIEIALSADKLSDSSAGCHVKDCGDGGRQVPICENAKLARVLLAARRNFECAVGSDFFADPARDILLDLFAASSEGRHISVTSACLAAKAPTSTALRHIRLLQSAGILEEYRCERDGRVRYLRLSAAIHGAITHQLDCLKVSLGNLIAEKEGGRLAA